MPLQFRHIWSWSSPCPETQKSFSGQRQLSQITWIPAVSGITRAESLSLHILIDQLCHLKIDSVAPGFQSFGHSPPAYFRVILTQFPFAA